MAWWSALALAGGCTDPTFMQDADARAEVDGAASSEGRRSQSSEAVEAGAERADAREEAPDSGEKTQDGGDSSANSPCEGGVCRSVEAGTSPAPTPADAGPASSLPEASVAPLDPVRAKWAGRYAARSAMFTYDDPFIDGVGRALSIVQIVPTSEGGLRLEEEMCYYEGDWQVFIVGVLRHTFKDARAGARLDYTSERFSSEEYAFQIGYGPTPPACSPGATIAKQLGQSWLTSTCDCSRTNDQPTSPRDCRVTDPEKDNEPGATFSAAIQDSPVELRLTQQVRARLLEGYRRGDRLYADRWFDETARIFSCLVNGMPTGIANCPQGGAKTCPSRYNKVELVPIEEPIKCDRVIAMEQALFFAPIPSFPSNCAAEAATQPRP